MLKYGWSANIRSSFSKYRWVTVLCCCECQGHEHSKGHRFIAEMASPEMLINWDSMTAWSSWYNNMGTNSANAMGPDIKSEPTCNTSDQPRGVCANINLDHIQGFSFG